MVMAAPSTTVSMTHLFYGAALGGQVLFYLLAGAGAVLEFMARRRESPPARPSAATSRAAAAVREVA